MQKRGCSILLFYLFVGFTSILLLSATLPVAFAEFVNEGGFVNLNKGETVEIVLPTNFSHFTKITQTLDERVPSLIYTATEGATLPSEPSEKVYRSLKIDYNVDPLGITMINFKVRKEIEFFEVYTYKTNWELASASPEYSTNTHTYYSIQTQTPQFIAITTNTSDVANADSQGETEAESTQAEIIEYVDDNQNLLYSGGIFLLVLIVVTIGAVTIHTVAKHHMGPSSIQRTDNKKLAELVHTAHHQKKTTGQIIDELLDKNYTLDEIVHELEKHGRKVPTNPPEE